ncbi:hypothetical protein GLAREA_01692 [Glarea lozoyensis ATCC 20868]|uniref:Uncharacterized protein n=1 Tax=Glarea lozoyensis (strain ATCC 20868 / MF5171) TaxID=1116229 RepID=S3CJ34_GLAL2|nr:uncharacterized protein GLAREA_01692 [Glarea lozoyensis ATCC 20868]EPE25780.1 hypothetical protein GLAREA_01692 [Glarea lozoyensis ATCC 20868]
MRVVNEGGVRGKTLKRIRGRLEEQKILGPGQRRLKAPPGSDNVNPFGSLQQPMSLWGGGGHHGMGGWWMVVMDQARQDKTFSLVAENERNSPGTVPGTVLYREQRGTGAMQGLHLGESSSMTSEQGGKAASSNGGRRAAYRTSRKPRSREATSHGP